MMGSIKDIRNVNTERTHANHESHKPPLTIGFLLSVHPFFSKSVIPLDELGPTRLYLHLLSDHVEIVVNVFRLRYHVSFVNIPVVILFNSSLPL